MFAGVELSERNPGVGVNNVLLLNAANTFDGAHIVSVLSPIFLLTGASVLGYRSVIFPYNRSYNAASQSISTGCFAFLPVPSLIW
jgi:hypothetical protein